MAQHGPENEQHPGSINSVEGQLAVPFAGLKAFGE